jgi:hypothetical protein
LATLIAIHDFLLLEQKSALGKHGQTQDGHGKRHFLVARNGRGKDDAARVTLRIDARQAVAFGTNAHHAARHKQRRSGLAAALHVAAAETSLYE